MRRLINITICCLCILAGASVPAQGGWLPWSGDILVTIGDMDYSADDFRSWWSIWREPGMSSPENPDTFIDFMLLFREAERMKLYEDPGYRKKVYTFLKARTLMLLKAEEVDGRITISDEDLWKRYQQKYAPLYLLNTLFFHTREDADRLLSKTGPGPISDEQLAELESVDNGPLKVTTRWYRMSSVDPGWHDIINALEKGKLSAPVESGKGVVILRLQERKEGDRDDFATQRKKIHETLRKEMADLRTVELINDLRKKYHVRVDKERLEKLDITAADDSFSDQPLVTMDNGTITEKDFMAQVRNTQRFRQKYGFAEHGAYQYKEQVLGNIINQTLTTWEGLARGYEKKSPFKEVFEFYCQNRMIKALENRLFAPQALVTQDEVRAYYDEHIEDYSRPDAVRMLSIEGSPEEINSLWTQVLMGGDFQALVRDRFDRPLDVQEFHVKLLPPEVKAVLQKLTKGELSPVFTVNGRASLVQLIERIPAQPMSLAKVGQQIHDLLYEEKLNRVRRDYVGRLRAVSPVTVNSEVWQQLQREMEQTDAKKTQ